MRSPEHNFQGIRCIDSRGCWEVKQGMGIVKKVAAAKAVSGRRDDKKEEKKKDKK